MNTEARARGSSNEWSALNEALYVVEGTPSLRVTEVMYAPREPVGVETSGGATATDFEFIELQNTGSETIGLAGITLSDAITFDFTDGAVHSLAPGEYVVIVKNLAAFSNRYDTSGMHIAGEYQQVYDFPLRTLADEGERIRIQDGHGSNLVSFTYDDGRGWPVTADGAGHSLVALQLDDQVSGALDYAGNWRASGQVDGSPGTTDPGPVATVVINEIAAHTDTALPPPDDSDDWVVRSGRTAMPRSGTWTT